MSAKNILVVDDEPNVVLSLTFVLKKEGFALHSAADGAEAIEKVRQSKPDLLFLDVMMPRKNGYEVCRELKQSPDFKDIYIIMLTAKGQEADREMGLSVGADEFITKPFEVHNIISRAKAILSEKDARTTSNVSAPVPEV